ncbi:hypothetical protein ACWF94_14615 [Streptomyces sp. NPDC055078]
MTPEALTAPAPTAFTATCIECRRPTSAPVRVRWLPSASGPGVTLYACPRCAPLLTPGPTPDEYGARQAT